MGRSRKERGAKTARLAAEYLKPFWPYAEATGAGAPGMDIKNILPFAPEVKATSGDPLLAALRQAKRNAGSLVGGPVIWRPNGYGEEKIDQWVAAFTFVDARELMAVYAGLKEA